MKVNFRFLLAVACLSILVSCSDDDSYQPIDQTSPVVMDLASVPYPKLSDYKFFDGVLNNQEPSYGVIPFKPASELFTDYARKKRFIWLPDGTVANYQSDGEVLNLPVGAALIKTFWYSNVQPSNVDKIIETRLMIRKTDGWILANYVWNDDQSEAFLDTEGGTVPVTWTENGSTRTINYQIPSAANCVTCHTLNSEITPIGIKPQNLNSPYAYPGGSQNQLQKLLAFGYLDQVPQTINSVVDYNDTSKSLDLRVRSYFDINCAHCHSDGASVDYLALRFNFDATANPDIMGVCMGAAMQPPGITHGQIVKPGNTAQSVLYFAMSTNLNNFKMPRIGRTIVHEEAVQMVGDWINSLPACP